MFGALLFPATAAVAHPYPPPPVSLTANVGTIVVGGTVTITGNGFGGCDLVKIYVTYGPAAAAVLTPAKCGATVAAPLVLPGFDHSVTADSNGHFVTTVKLTTVGTATITAIGFPSGFFASTTVQVTASLQQMASESDSGQSAGSNISAGAVAALTLPVLALALVLILRRRSRTRAGA
jgi:hypothetical protein